MKVTNPATDTTALRIATVLFSGLIAVIAYQIITERDLRVCSGNGPAAERIAACSRVIEDYAANDEASSAAYEARGRAYRELGDTDGAIEDFTTALAKDGTNTNALFQRSATYALKEEYQSAIRDSELALQRQPEGRHIRKLNGLLLFKTGKPNEAILELNAVLEDEPHDVSTLLMRAVAHLDTGEKGSAERDARRALEIDPEDEEAKELLEALGAAPYWKGTQRRFRSPWRG